MLFFNDFLVNLPNLLNLALQRQLELLGIEVRCNGKSFLTNYHLFLDLSLSVQTGSILESKDMHAIFQKKDKKSAKNVKKGQNVLKFGQKCAKFENILKKGR